MNQTAKTAIFQQYKWFIQKQRKTLEQWFERGQNYLPHARRVFVEQGLPEDLAYLAFIESGYNPYAYSRARAAGCWQFMSYTGRRFDLRYASWIDERRDPVRSAEAAAAYLKLLYGIFDDWSLAIASYNAGEGKIGRAVRLTGATNFFELAERNRRLRGRARLARETLNYVPRFLAMVKIAKKHELLGFAPMDFNKAQDLLQVKAQGPVSLAHLAASVGLSWDEFKFCNPSFRTRYIPARQSAYIYVPQAKAEALNAYLSDKEVRVAAETIIKRTQASHKVRRGDTLSRLAKKYGTTIGEIKKANHLRSSLIRIGQRLVIPKEEEVVVAKLIKPLKKKEEKAAAPAGKNAVAQKTPPEQQEVVLKPGQLAQTSAPRKPAESAAPRKQQPAAAQAVAARKPHPAAVHPVAAQTAAKAGKAAVTQAAPVYDAPKQPADKGSGNALVQGLLGMAVKKQAVAKPAAAAKVAQISQASPRQAARAKKVVRAATPLQVPERRSIQEWYAMLAKADLTWGAPQPSRKAQPVGKALQAKHAQLPEARQDRAASSGPKAVKPGPVPAPSARQAAASGASSRILSPLPVRFTNSGAPTYGHSMRRKISKTTYRAGAVAGKSVARKDNGRSGPSVLETLHGFSKELQKGFVKFFSWGSEPDTPHGVRRDVAQVTRSASRS